MVHGSSKQKLATEFDRIRRLLEYPPKRKDSKVEPAPLNTVFNLQIILGQDSDFYPHLGFNEFTGEVTWDQQPLTDHLETAINCQIGGEVQAEDEHGARA